MSNSKCCSLLFTVSLIFFSVAISISNNAYAVPAFARQTGNPCKVCHYQHFPKLTPYGRAFKANGYSLSAQELLEDQDGSLSIPPNLNATFFITSKYEDDSSERDGKWAIPDEAAILAGGRLAEGVGGMVEWGGPLLSAKVSFTKPLGDHVIGTTVFTTDGLGAGYGFEVMNTGAVRNHRPFEQSSQPTLGSNPSLEISQAATGLAFFFDDSHYGSADDPDWFVSATLFAPDSNEAGLTELDAGTNLSTYFRGAYMPTIGGFNTGIGFGVYSGKTKATITGDGASLIGGSATSGDVYEINTKAWFVDAQLEGMVGGKDLGVYLMYAEGDDPTSGTNQFNLWGSQSGTDKPKGWGLDAEYSMTPSVHLLAALGKNDDGGPGDKQTVGLGLYWQIYQNVSLQPMYEKYSGTQGEDSNGDAITLATLTLQAGF